MNDNYDACMKEAAELLAEQKRKNLEYCDKLTALADSILETRIRVDEMMVDQLMAYYSLDCSLDSPEIWEKAIKQYCEGGTTGLLDTLVRVSDQLRIECHKIKTEEIRTFM